jgi:hypothetical protein
MKRVLAPRVARFFLVQFTSAGKKTNYRKIYQTATKYLKLRECPLCINMLTSSIAGPYKIYPNCDFWSENIPSGKPACTVTVFPIMSALQVPWINWFSWFGIDCCSWINQFFVDQPVFPALFHQLLFKSPLE